MKNLIKTGSLLLIIAFIYSCESLEIENLNKPETSRVLATSADFGGVLNGAALQWWNSLHKGDPYMTLLVAGDFGTASWGNFGMQNVGTVGAPYGLGSHEPIQNSVTYNYKNFIEVPYAGLYSVTSSANDIIVAVDANETLSDAKKSELKAFGYFLRGLGFGYLGLIYDKSLVFDENTQNINELTYDDFVTYDQVVAKGIADMESAIVSANAATSISITAFNGITIDKEKLIRLANGYIAKFMVHGARSAAETANINWNTVLQKSQAANAVATGLSPIGDGGTNWWSSMIYSNNPGWMRLDQKIVNMANPSSPYPFPADGYDSDETALPLADGRFGGKEDGKTFAWAGAAPFRANRGTYFFSNWAINNRIGYRGNLTDPMPSFSIAENKLTLAEAMIRTQTPGAAAIINETRVANGNLAAAADSDSDLLDKLMYERYLEAFDGPGNPYFDRRRTDDLGANQFKSLPVPAKNLNAWEAPAYTTGGPQ